MKKALLFVIGLMLTSTLLAGPVGKEEAKAKALTFLAGKVGTGDGRAKAPLQEEQLSLATTGDAYHVFNIGSDGGFVIVSASDLTPDIIGYTDEGTFDANNIPDNMKAWLQEYANQIAWAEKNGEQVTESKVRKAPATSTVKSAIAPLIQTKWDQDEPYNLNLPMFKGGSERCATGCVATAMAQVLYYQYQNVAKTDYYPTATTGLIPEYKYGLKKWGTEQTFPETPVTPFEWDKMQLTYTGSETLSDPAAKAVADLMLCCGASLEMDYGTTSSSNSMKIAEALKNYFGYDEHSQNVRRCQYTSMAWEELIYNEILAGRPVIYSGSSSSSGHAFICDGYDVDGYFHVNWGWGGLANGYFLLSVLNSNSVGVGGGAAKDGYTMDQDAVIGIQKPTGYLVNDACLKVNSLDYLGSSPVDEFSTKVNFSCSVKMALDCHATYTRHYDINLGIFDESDHFVYAHSAYVDNWEIAPANRYSTWTVSLYVNMSKMESGHTYKIKPVYKLHGTDTWIPFENSEKHYIQAETVGSTATLSVVNPLINLSATDVKLTTDGIVNTLQTVTTKVTNNSSDDYHGNVYLYNHEDDLIASYGLHLEAGEFTIVPFTFIPTATCADKQWTIKTGVSDSSIGSGHITINAGVTSDNTPELTSAHQLNLSDDKQYILGTKLVDKVTLKNKSTTKAFQGWVALRVYTWNGLSWSATSTPNQQVIILPNGSIDVTFEKDVEINGTYSVCTRYYHGSSWENALPDVHETTYVAKPAIKLIAADGKETFALATASYAVPAGAAVVDLRGQSVVTSITPNSNPNCLYLLDASAATPEGISNNVVKGTTAEKIMLTDGYDFYTPIDFTATSISYTRQFTSGADGSGKGWSTIMLPFDVQKVKRMDTDTEIKCFLSSSDKNKNFWLYQFVIDGKGTVNFDYASSIKANTPYLITVPSDKWGAEFDLRNKDITFSATDVTVKANEKNIQSGFYYMFTGGSQKTAVTDCYVMNAEGNKFAKTTGNAPAFQAYFYPSSHNLQSDALAISFVDNSEVTGILSVESEEQTTGAAEGWYTLQGVKLDGEPTQKGIYIYNGKKVMVK